MDIKQFIKLMEDETKKSLGDFANYRTPNKIFEDVVSQYPQFNIFRNNFFNGELKPIIPYKTIILSELDLPYKYTDECGDSTIIKTLFNKKKFDTFISRLSLKMPVDDILRTRLEYAIRTTYDLVSINWFRDIMQVDENMLDLIYGAW